MASRILDRRAVTFGLAGALCMPSILRAQTNYPDRPINVIVPFAAGGPTDAIARIYAEFLSRDLGQTLVIENVAGAGGTIGSPPCANHRTILERPGRWWTACWRVKSTDKQNDKKR